MIAGYSLLRWTDSDQIDGGKLSTLSSAARDTGSLDAITRAFFGSIVPGLPYLLLLVVLVLAGTAIVLSKPALAWTGAGLAVLLGLWGVYAKRAVDDFLVTPDHSTGALVALLGYLAIAAACVVVARSHREEADTRGFIDQLFSWRPGLPLVVLGFLTGLVALLGTGWFSPGNKNDHYAGLASRFSGTGVNVLTSAYLTWLGTLLFVVALGLAAAATYLRRRDLGWSALVVSVVSIVVTLTVMHDFTAVAAKVGFDTITKPWKDLGVGGWLLCIAYTVLAGAGLDRRDSQEPRRLALDRAGRGRLRPRRHDLRQLQQGRAVRRDRGGAVLPADGDPVLADGAGLRDRHLRAARHRAQRGRRLGRSARPGLHRVLRDRVVHHRVPRRRAPGATAALGDPSAAGRDPVRHRHLPARRR